MVRIKHSHFPKKKKIQQNSLLGYRFTFSNKTKSDSIKYSPGSLFENQNGSFDIHLNFSTSGRPVIGTWLIRLENMKEVYNVRVYAFTNIAAQAWIHSIIEGK